MQSRRGSDRDRRRPVHGQFTRESAADRTFYLRTAPKTGPAEVTGGWVARRPGPAR